MLSEISVMCRIHCFVSIVKDPFQSLHVNILGCVFMKMGTDMFCNQCDLVVMPDEGKGGIIGNSYQTE